MNSNFDRQTSFRAGWLGFVAGLFFIAQCSTPALAFPRKHPAASPENPGAPGPPRTAIVRSGMLETRDGLTLRLSADLGSVNITQLEPGASSAVRYTAHVETDAREALARELLNNYSLKAGTSSAGVEITSTLFPPAAHYANAQFWVQFEIAVPRNYNVEVNTGAGDISTGNIGGTALLKTLGGNISAGRIGRAGLREAPHGRAVARLETEGGHIKVLDVTGDLVASTGGGHINAGNITADASLHSGGGHIRAGRIGGRADLETVGGNIAVGQAQNFVSVRTGAGQIDFGEVRGSVRAQTGGGGIHVMLVSGPMEVESSGGSICVTSASGALQAASSGGGITAWINPSAAGKGPVRLEGPSQLASGTGDIIVYLPRNLAANIDALVANGTEQHILADADLHLTMQGPVNGLGPVHAVAVLNGGGAPLRLRTTGGRIRLQYIDSQVALRESLMHEQAERLNKRLTEAGLAPVAFPPSMWPTPAAVTQVTPPPVDPLNDNNFDWIERFVNNLELTFRGSITQDPDDFLKRLTYRPGPSYPSLAERAGIHGFVTLQVKLTKDGRVEVQKVMGGEPVLADAAIDAVKRWRGRPAWMSGKPCEVISTVKFDFQLPR